MFTLFNTLDAWNEANPGSLFVIGAILAVILIASLAIWLEMEEKK